ncbi:MAG: hydrogenase expression/formation protein HypE [Candidatus Aminicenantes bacterium RBG_13_64_14]|nr:MAG: hydrogenase expression/formation protein HypE [Candidatus Aminicenantes bacterium RBG_13_64_14]
MKKVSLELGSGGRQMRDFTPGTTPPSFGNPVLDELSDASHLPGGVAFTTDSYVVDPLFFPGGDIGRLAVNGTVNDLVVSGAEPKFLSLALILEEGLDFSILERVIRSIRAAARTANIRIVTGDTKVVRRGQGDKIYINTAGIGRSIAHPRVRKIRPGDKVILTGTLGDHSLAVMLARGDFGLSSSVRSDCAPLLFLLPLWKKGALWMRDVTRGGLATVLFELAERLRYPLLIEEDKIPLSKPVLAASELLGIDPLYMACEGKAVVIAPKAKVGEFLRLIRNHPLGRKAAVIGEVQDRVGRPGELLLQTAAGGLRLLEPLTSELLPRIC